VAHAPRFTISGDERRHLAEARVGQLVLGKWRLDRLIGVGGTAAVFEATHHNGSRAAIKLLHPDLAGFEEIRERFLAESYAANRVAHAGVVTVRDEGTTDDGAVFLVMDLLQGQTLAERRSADTPLSVGEVLEIARQLLDVLAQAHARGIVHCDIKPENVFLTREGRVRLLDFGVARCRALDLGHANDPGHALGTPAFMAPEQAFGNSAELDGRSDLWSLGATMYLLLSGMPVRESGSAAEQLLGAMTRTVRSLGEVTDLPRSVVAVVDRALAFDRDDRFPDARSMQLAVLATRDELSAPDSRVGLPPPSLEPVVRSLRTPLPKAPASRHLPSAARPQTPAYGSLRPVATAALLPPPRKVSRSALPLYVGFGFALGLSIVVTARLNMHAAAPEPVVLPERAAATLLPAGGQAPSASAALSSSAASNAAQVGTPPRASSSEPRN
jgi:eukaryotic-like serine/threonine-protein kinase